MGLNSTTDRLLKTVSDKLADQQTSLDAINSTGTLSKNANDNVDSQITSQNARLFGQMVLSWLLAMEQATSLPAKYL